MLLDITFVIVSLYMAGDMYQQAVRCGPYSSVIERNTQRMVCGWSLANDFPMKIGQAPPEINQ